MRLSSMMNGDYLPKNGSLLMALPSLGCALTWLRCLKESMDAPRDFGSPS